MHLIVRRLEQLRVDHKNFFRVAEDGSSDVLSGPERERTHWPRARAWAAPKRRPRVRVPANVVVGQPTRATCGAGAAVSRVAKSEAEAMAA
jgi:hypothetical protein